MTGNPGSDVRSLWPQRAAIEGRGGSRWPPGPCPVPPARGSPVCRLPGAHSAWPPPTTVPGEPWLQELTAPVRDSQNSGVVQKKAGSSLKERCFRAPLLEGVLQQASHT